MNSIHQLLSSNKSNKIKKIKIKEIDSGCVFILVDLANIIILLFII